MFEADYNSSSEFSFQMFHYVILKLYRILHSYRFAYFAVQVAEFLFCPG